MEIVYPINKQILEFKSIDNKTFNVDNAKEYSSSHEPSLIFDKPYVFSSSFKLEIEKPIFETKQQIDLHDYSDLKVTNMNSTFEAINILKYKCPSWRKTFEDSESELKVISDALDRNIIRNGHYVPNKKNLFKAFELTPLDTVKVVIVGQDPYHQILHNGEPRATGLSFSVHETDEIPSSLQNIYKEISSEIPSWQHPRHGNLTSWAKQGVLMLNICLTCVPGNAGSHSKYKLWMPFIIKVLNEIKKYNPKCIFVMWGAKAQEIDQYIGEKSVKLVSAHPSGLSASRGFFKCGHFVKINEHLVANNQTPISW